MHQRIRSIENYQNFGLKDSIKVVDIIELKVLQYWTDIKREFLIHTRVTLKFICLVSGDVRHFKLENSFLIRLLLVSWWINVNNLCILCSIFIRIISVFRRFQHQFSVDEIFFSLKFQTIPNFINSKLYFKFNIKLTDFGGSSSIITVASLGAASSFGSSAGVSFFSTSTTFCGFFLNNPSKLIWYFFAFVCFKSALSVSLLIGLKKERKFRFVALHQRN